MVAKLAKASRFILINNKGGVGKTTSATNIAYLLTLLLAHANAPKQKILLVDLDPQAHSTLLTTGKGKFDYDVDDSLVAVLRAKREDLGDTLRDCIINTEWHDNLDILPSSDTLEAQQDNMIGENGAIYKIDDALEHVSEDYAAVIFDSMPSYSLLTRMGMVASQHVIVPIEPAYLSSEGLISVINKVEEIRLAWRVKQLQVSGMIVTKYKRGTIGSKQIEETITQDEVLSKLLLGVIPERIDVDYSHNNHLPLFEYDRNNDASTEYLKVAQRMAEMMFAGVR